MPFAGVGGTSIRGGYAIDNSVRLNDNDSAGFSRTNQSSPTDAKIFTWSGWVKRGNIDTSSALFNGASGNNVSSFYFRGSGSQNYIRLVETSDNFVSYDTLIDTQMLFRDIGAWYHVVLKYDSTNGTANDRAIIYVNGVQVDLTISNTVDSNYTSPLNEGSYSNYLGRASGGNYLDGYLAEVNFIDGQALSPTDFGEFDEDSGIWKPIEYTGTYGTNGFYLDFENSGSLGADQSGNGNNFTPTNIVSTDQMIDTPTRNFCTMNPLDRLNIGGANSEQVTSEGNLKSTGTGSEGRSIGSTFAITPNGISKAYAEWYSVSGSSSKDLFYSNNINGYIANDDATAGNIVMMAVDCVAGKYWFGNNGTWDASGDPANGTNPTGTFTANSEVQFGHRCYDSSRSQVVNFGQDSTFAGNTTRQNNTDSNGEGDFYYAPPTGFLSLNSSNLSTQASPTIDDGSQYFNTVLYTGTGSDLSITGVGFQPDWTWIKSRSNANNHNVFDSSRGQTKRLYPNLTDAEDTVSGFTLDSDGFSTGTSSIGDINVNGATYVSWNWKANAGSTSSNTDGSITSTVQANTTAGFSIVTWTETTANSQTIGHGLGKTPAMIITKLRDDNVLNPAWYTFHQSIGKGERVMLDSTSGDVTSGFFNGTLDSSVFHVSYGDAYDNKSVVAYCFAEIEGYSKFGKYTGNGSSDGTFVYTGFKPAFTLIKRTDAVQAWVLHDSARAGYINPTDNYVYANATNVEAEDIDLDYLSNGFKIRSTFNDTNASGGTYIYMAFAENPFVSSTGIPVVAR